MKLVNIAQFTCSKLIIQCLIYKFKVCNQLKNITEMHFSRAGNGSCLIPVYPFTITVGYPDN